MSLQFVSPQKKYNAILNLRDFKYLSSLENYTSTCTGAFEETLQVQGNFVGDILSVEIRA